MAETTKPTPRVFHSCANCSLTFEGEFVPRERSDVDKEGNPFTVSEKLCQGCGQPKRKVKTKIYCFYSKKETDSGIVNAIIATNKDKTERIASDICTESFKDHVMGFTSIVKHPLYDRRLGIGNWELEWVNTPKEHPICMKYLDSIGWVPPQ